jgi:1,2-diacylglycerol 3-beta-galactosyltransferase
LCIVPTNLSKDYVVEGGVAPDKVRITGLPVSLKFLHQTSKMEAQKGLDLLPNLLVVLLVGGGEGMGPVYKISRAIAKAGPKGQLVIVAGRNERLRKRLEDVEWEIPTKVFGFVTNMPQLMAAGDLIVTKAGPSTISEAMISGLPIILSGFIPGQEEGNVEYVVKSGAGLLAEKSKQIAQLVAEWLEPSNPVRFEMAEKARLQGRPRAALDIAAEIYGLIG